MLDQYFEKRYKKSQNELLSTKSKLFENEYVIDNLLNEVKKYKKENRLLSDKVKSLEKDSDMSQRKTTKYK